MRAPAAHASPALSREAYFATLAKRHGVENQQKLARARVGIAGLGGLGSAAACHLARLGVGTLVLVDFDVVDVSNLHRQQYTCAQVGMKKTEALAETLRAINPFVELELHSVKVTAENAPTLFAGCPIVCEAFDEPNQKALLVETLLATRPDTTIVSGSGMAVKFIVFQVVLLLTGAVMWISHGAFVDAHTQGSKWFILMGYVVNFFSVGT